MEFRSQGGDDSEQNLITLCAACHSLAHRQNEGGAQLKP
jgi:predicted HNH restriction endonuclease